MVKNIGVSTRNIYDKCYLPEYTQEIVSPGQYRTNPNHIYNCNGCNSTFGPRGVRNGVATPLNTQMLAPSQKLVDVESVLSNRNVKQSRCRKGKTNPIRPNDYELYEQPLCSEQSRKLDPVSTLLTHPRYNYKEMPINRFYDLNKNPQENIFWNFAVNTGLEARDNYVPLIPSLWNNQKACPTADTEMGQERFCYPPRQ